MRSIPIFSLLFLHLNWHILCACTPWKKEAALQQQPSAKDAEKKFRWTVMVVDSDIISADIA